VAVSQDWAFASIFVRSVGCCAVQSKLLCVMRGITGNNHGRSYIPGCSRVISVWARETEQVVINMTTYLAIPELLQYKRERTRGRCKYCCILELICCML
jgi:hypothetical protein